MRSSGGSAIEELTVTEDDARRKTRMKRVNGKKRWRGVVKCQQDVTRLISVETVQAMCNERRSGATANYFDDAGRAWAKTSKKKDRGGDSLSKRRGEKEELLGKAGGETTQRSQEGADHITAKCGSEALMEQHIVVVSTARKGTGDGRRWMASHRVGGEQRKGGALPLGVWWW
jgi:hypothetical protein